MFSSVAASHLLPSTAKRRRLADDEEEENVCPRADETGSCSLQSLPEELLLRLCSYLDWNSVLAVASLSRDLSNTVLDSVKLWKELALRNSNDNNNNNMACCLEDAFESLRGQVMPYQNPRISQALSSVRLNDAALWRRLWASRKRSLQEVLVEGQDYNDSVTDSGLPGWMEPLPQYRFALHVWGVDGIKRTMTFPASGFSRLRLEVGDKSSLFGSILSKGEFHALEIELFAEGSSPVVLYSSLNPLQVYGGGSFEEYSAMPWFEGEEVFEYDSERYDWLPFVVVDIAGTNYIILNFEIQWWSRGPEGKRGDDYHFVSQMNYTEVRTFLRHRLRRGEHNAFSSDEPHCFVAQSMAPTSLPRENYAPKPLNSYSFIIDVKNITDPSKRCSLYVESVDDIDMPVDEDDTCSFNLEIPARYDHFFPYADDYEDEENPRNFLWMEIGTIISVFVVDRRTGMQAKLYESDNDCAVWEYFQMKHFCAFEKSAALTLYSENGYNANSIPVPSTLGFLTSAWKNYDPPDTLRYLSIHFGMQAGLERVECTMTNFLVFLEKGLVYK